MRLKILWKLGGFYNKATNKLYDEDVKLIKEFKDFTSSIVLSTTRTYYRYKRR